MMKLLLRLDDFGASPGANDAILDIAASGVPVNIGVMAPGPFRHHHWDKLLAIQSEVCVGVHATVTSEWATLRWGPVSSPNKVPSLLRGDGSFFSDVQALNKEGSTEEILAEVRAQIAALRREGLEPRYLDTHMGFAWLPGVDDGLAQICGEENLVYAHAAQFRSFSWQKPKRLEESASNKVFVCVFHPAYRDAVSERFFATDPDPAISAGRAREAALLQDPRFLKRLADSGPFSFARYHEKTPS
jgi:predicted glycoside hydrolase/deacetylase ChbG (UPF0249 family)